MEPENRYNKENNLDTEIAKHKDNETHNYLFKKDKITTRSFFFIAAVLLFLIIGVAVTAIFF